MRWSSYVTLRSKRLRTNLRFTSQPMSADNHLMEQKRGSHLWLTIDRAEKANALTVGLMERITAAIAEAANDANVTAVFLTGAGERVFCAGVDVREQPADGNAARHREQRSA